MHNCISPVRYTPTDSMLPFKAYCCRMGRTERQSARMSKITNDGLTRSGTGCFIAVPIWQQ